MTATASADHSHIPVMLREVVKTMAPQSGEVYVDGTFGAGGYTRALLEAADCTVYAIDRDPEAIIRAEKMAQDFKNRLIPLAGCFGEMKNLLAATGISQVDGIVLDIGVSSIQLSTASRGFSFLQDGPLDMRMSKSGQSAADVVNTFDEKEIADIIYKYGEEKASRRIAARIVKTRAEQPITTTLQLAELVADVLPPKGKSKIHPATRTFQALRIFVNDELGELERALEAAIDLLKPNGRLVVVTFHSLEDWRVKTFLREKSGRNPNVSRHTPMTGEADPVLFKVIKNQGLTPQDDETDQNPRARSARLRYGIRTEEAQHHA